MFHAIILPELLSYTISKLHHKRKFSSAFLFRFVISLFHFIMLITMNVIFMEVIWKWRPSENLIFKIPSQNFVDRLTSFAKDPNKCILFYDKIMLHHFCNFSYWKWALVNSGWSRSNSNSLKWGNSIYAYIKQKQ